MSLFGDNVTSVLYDAKEDSNFTSKDSSASQLLEVICNQYIGPILCAFGIIGNTLSLIVSLYGKLRDPPYLYIRALAVMDTCALLVSFPFMVFSIGSTSYHWKWYEAYLFIPLANFFTASSVWITVTMTIERYVVVKFPIWAKSGCSRCGVHFRIWMVLCAATLNCIPRFFTYTVNHVSNGSYKLKPTPFRKGNVYYGIDIFCIIFLHFFPLVILGIGNALLILEVRRAQKARKVLNIRNNRETEFQKDQRRLSITLISIVVLSLCFIVPATVSDIFLYSKFHKRPSGRQISRVVRNLANVLLWCNLSFNFILYCAFNKRFVRILRKMISLRPLRDKNNLLISTRASMKTTDTTFL
ncbi:hypothetical protein FSP39_024435 [Pinctada imbricata]|uniref:G-protein coupled receptors family 1 profile domain-containing protein n=1 Tax=Pinctada imbricata TaxID=66713 RepID=A0AA88Y9I6_PINIB|nr:hypothetical protein FSP39_024435 [Pinctada imbricata]